MVTPLTDTLVIIDLNGKSYSRNISKCRDICIERFREFYKVFIDHDDFHTEVFVAERTYWR